MKFPFSSNIYIILTFSISLPYYCGEHINDWF